MALLALGGVPELPDLINPFLTADDYMRSLPFLREGREGDWHVELFDVDENGAMLSKAQATLNGSRRYCPPGRYWRLRKGGDIVMTNTPNEIRDHLEVVKRATGSVLINGLGLGMCTYAILQKESVTDVTVVESSEEVIRLVGNRLRQRRLTIIHDDAHTYQPPKGKRYDVVWHDIWNTICADHLPDMHHLHRRYGKRCDWQGSWCRQEMERHSKQDFYTLPSQFAELRNRMKKQP